MRQRRASYPRIREECSHRIRLTNAYTSNLSIKALNGSNTIDVSILTFQFYRFNQVSGTQPKEIPPPLKRGCQAGAATPFFNKETNSEKRNIYRHRVGSDLMLTDFPLAKARA